MDVWMLEEYPCKDVGFLMREWHQHGGYVVEKERGSKE
jgi:hypothetical protein